MKSSRSSISPRRPWAASSSATRASSSTIRSAWYSPVVTGPASRAARLRRQARIASEQATTSPMEPYLAWFQADRGNLNRFYNITISPTRQAQFRALYRQWQELLTNAALFVLPSDLEGLSLALLDAMGAGVCVLTSDVPETVTMSKRVVPVVA